MRIAVLSSAFFASLSLVACAASDRVVVGNGGTGIPAGETSETLPAVTDAASFCGAMCNRVQSCDKSLDTQTCQNECTNGNAAVFPRLRSDVVSLIVECFDGKDCKTVLGGEFVGACTADAIATVAPSAAASSFCDALAGAKKTCSGATSKTKADCLNTSKLYGDAAIAQAQNCVKRGCSEIDTCVSAVFGSLGGSVTTTKPSTSGECTSGQFSDLGSCSTCAETSCCAEASACYGDSECREIARSCFVNGTSSTYCSQAYSSATTSARSLASTLLSCSSSKCSGTCQVGGG
jgi:hypothetical protein